MIFSKWLDHRLVAARKYVLAAGVLLVACVTPLCAQQSQQLTPPRDEGKIIFGTATFGDDIDHNVIGGALRVYVTKRLSIEPEYLRAFTIVDANRLIVELTFIMPNGKPIEGRGDFERTK